MKKLVLLFILVNSLWGKQENSKRDSFYLQQVDYRTRSTIAISIPGFARLRFRPSIEKRYKVKKEIIKVSKDYFNKKAP